MEGGVLVVGTSIVAIVAKTMTAAKNKRNVNRDLTEEKADLPFQNKIGRSAY